MKKIALLGMLLLVSSAIQAENTTDSAIPTQEITSDTIDMNGFVDPLIEGLLAEEAELFLFTVMRINRLVLQKQINDNAQQHNQQLEELAIQNKALQERVAELEEKDEQKTIVIVQMKSQLNYLGTKLAQFEYKKNSEGIIGG